MNVLELFSGTASFSKVAAAHGHDCRTLDNDPQFKPSYCMDIMDFTPGILGTGSPKLSGLRHPASPFLLW
jgi:hypothetical protein